MKLSILHHIGLRCPTATDTGPTSSGPTIASPGTIENDVILEQTETIYDDASNIIQSTKIQRYQNNTNFSGRIQTAVKS